MGASQSDPEPIDMVLLVSASTSSQSELKGLKLAAADCLGAVSQ